MLAWAGAAAGRRGSDARRGAALLCCALLAALCLPPVGGRAQEASAIARIQAAGTLTVAMFFEDVPPFFHTDAEGRLTGIDPSLAADIAAKLGVEVAYNRAATTFDGIVDEVAEGRADIAISLLSDTLERAMRVRFSDSYVDVRQFLLINRLELGRLARDQAGGVPVPVLLNDAEARIGVIAGTSYVGFVQEDFPDAERVEFDDWDAMLEAVRSGELVALMYDEIEIGNWRLADPAGALELRPFHLEGRPDTIAIAMRRGDGDLKDWIDLYLQKIRDNGQLDALLRTHLYASERALTND